MHSLRGTVYIVRARVIIRSHATVLLYSPHVWGSIFRRYPPLPTSRPPPRAHTVTHRYHRQLSSGPLGGYREKKIPPHFRACFSPPCRQNKPEEDEPEEELIAEWEVWEPEEEPERTPPPPGNQRTPQRPTPSQQGEATPGRRPPRSPLWDIEGRTPVPPPRA